MAGRKSKDDRFHVTPKVRFLPASKTDLDLSSCFVQNFRTLLLETNMSLTFAAHAWILIQKESSCRVSGKVKSNTTSQQDRRKA